MAKDVRALREEAAEATASGKYKRALAAYLELERLDPRDAQWAKRAGETYRRLGNNKHAIEAFERSADRYAQNGFLVQAIAVCKLVLQIDPQHAEALRRLSSMNEQLGAGPTRAAGMAENNPALHENPNVNALRRPGSTLHPRAKPPTTGQVPQKVPTGRVPVIRDAPAIGTGSTPITTVPAQPTPRTTPNVPVTRPATAIGSSTPRTGTPAITGRPSAAAPVRQADARAPSVPDPRAPQSSGVPVRVGAGTSSSTSLPAPPRAAVPVPVAPAPRTAPVDAEPPQVSRTRSPAPAMSRTKTSTPPHMALPRTKSKPISLPPGAAIDSVNLAAEMPAAQLRDGSIPGIHVIPLDDTGYDLDPMSLEDPAGETHDYDRVSVPIIEIEPPDEHVEAELEEQTELELDDIEEIPLPEPLYMGAAAHKALQATPLFAGLPSDALEALVSELSLVHLDTNEVLFKEGDPGDALYVIVEGEVSVQAEGPPRVEMARLGAGSFIGEVALMTDQPRSATVSAIAAAELLRIDRHTLSRVLANHGDVLRAVLRFVRDRLVDRWMRTSPLFRPFDEHQRAELANKFNFLEIEDGTRLIDAGARPDGLYIVLAGHFIAERDGTVVATLGAGELIGETALLSGAAFKSNISARGKSLALHLPAGEFREIIMTHPHVLEYIGEQAEHSRRLQIL